MAQQPAAPIPSSRRHAARRLVVAVCLLLAAAMICVAVAYVRFTNPTRLRTSIETLIQPYAAGKVTVGEARFTMRDGLRLANITIVETSVQSGSAGSVSSADVQQLFECREILIRLNAADLLLQTLTIESITLVEPRIAVVHSEPSNSLTIAGIDLSSLPSGTNAAAFPAIELRSAQVTVTDVLPGRRQVLDRLTLDIRGLPSVDSRNLYDITWRNKVDNAEHGHLRVDHEADSIRSRIGGLPWISLDAAAMLAGRIVKDLPSQMKSAHAKGRIRFAEFSWTADDNPEGRYAELELENSSFSIPIDEHEQTLSDDDRYIRFDRISGRAIFSPSAINARLEGAFHGATVSLDVQALNKTGRFDSLDSYELDLQLHCNDWVLPRPEHGASESRFLSRWSRLSKFQRDFDPGGPAELTLHVGKSAAPRASFVLQRGKLMFHGGSASCRLFPYSVHDLRGSLEYSPQGLTVNSVCGLHETGEVCANGWMSDLTSCAAGFVEVNGQSIPIDSALYAGAPPHLRRLHDQFCPQGTINVGLILTRGRCEDGAPSMWRTRSTIEFKRVAASFVDFPVPLTNLTGAILFEKGNIEISHVRGRSNDAMIAIDGSANLSGGALDQLDLKIDVIDLALDESLFQAFPERMRGAIGEINPNGWVDVQSRIQLDPQSGRLVQESEIRLNDITLATAHFPWPIDRLNGTLHLSDQFSWDDLSGVFRGSAVRSFGALDFGDWLPDPEIHLVVSDLAVDDELVSALPHALHHQIGDWRLSGPSELELLIRLDPRQTPNVDRFSHGGELPEREHGQNPEGEAPHAVALNVSGLLRLDGGHVSHPGLPTPLTQTFFRLSFDDHKLSGAVLDARCGHARLQADFRARRDDSGRYVDASLKATDLPIDNLTLAFAAGASKHWPPGQGQIDLQIDNLNYRKPADHAAGTCTIDGRAQFRNLTLIELPELAVHVGSIEFAGALLGENAPSLAGTLAVDSATIRGHELTALRGEWMCQSDPTNTTMLQLEQVDGRMYDGMIRGDLTTTFSPNANSYDLSLSLRDVDVRPFVINKADSDSFGAPNNKSADVSGWIDGQLAISGVTGMASTRRGSGRFEVKNGRLYRLPLLAAILQVMNLTLPTEDTLDEANAEFLLEGNRILFDSIELRGKSLGLVGNGTMSLPDQGINLHLVNVNPRLSDRWPLLSDIAREVSKELVELHVTGPLYQPRVTTTPFRGLTDELRELFRAKKQRNVNAAKP